MSLFVWSEEFLDSWPYHALSFPSFRDGNYSSMVDHWQECIFIWVSKCRRDIGSMDFGNCSWYLVRERVWMKRDNQLECGNSFVDDSRITSAYHRWVTCWRRQVGQVVESVMTLTSSTRMSVAVQLIGHWRIDNTMSSVTEHWVPSNVSARSKLIWLFPADADDIRRAARKKLKKNGLN